MRRSNAGTETHQSRSTFSTLYTSILNPNKDLFIFFDARNKYMYEDAHSSHVLGLQSEVVGEVLSAKAIIWARRQEPIMNRYCIMRSTQQDVLFSYTYPI